MHTFAAESCPVCGKGTWRAFSDGVHSFRHKRQTISVAGMHYALCDHCGARGYLRGQLDENRRLIRSTQSKIPGYISPAEVLAIREKYLLTQEVAAKIFGGGIQAFSKWETGKVIPAEPTAKLMRLALEDSKVLKRLAQWAGVELPAVGGDERGTDIEVTFPLHIVERSVTKVKFVHALAARIRTTPTSWTGSNMSTDDIDLMIVCEEPSHPEGRSLKLEVALANALH